MYKALVATAGIAVLATAGAGLGLTAASAAPARAQYEQFRFMDDTPGSLTFSAIATGTFTAGGSFDAASDPGTLTFPDGTFKAASEIKSTRDHTDSRTCLFTRVRTETYQLTDGTGAYAGIGGFGTAVSRVEAILARVDGSCSSTAVPQTYQQTIIAKGSVSLPTPIPTPTPTPTPTKSAE